MTFRANSPREETMSTYLESDAVLAAKQQTQEHRQAKPTYSSRWESYLADTLDKLNGRQPVYDPTTDPVYQSYRRAYTRKGRLAMEDTLGKTTALTGGYGNSWAASAAQQTYDTYLQALTDKIPQLYQLAQDRYDAETKQLNAQYQQYLQREQQDQAQFEEIFDRWLQELELLQDREQALAKEDFDRYQDQRDWEEAHPAPDSAGGTAGTTTGTTTGTSGASGGYDNGSVSAENIKKIQAALGVAVDGKWGPESRKAAGGVDADTAWANYQSEFGG